MAVYLDWLKDIFEEAQVSYTPETAPYLDAALRKMTGTEKSSEEEVFNRIRQRWLRQGPPGRQLLGALIRDEVYSRRDSPLRPQEGAGYYTNAYQPTAHVPRPPHGDELPTEETPTSR